MTQFIRQISVCILVTFDLDYRVLNSSRDFYSKTKLSDGHIQIAIWFKSLSNHLWRFDVNTRIFDLKACDSTEIPFEIHHNSISQISNIMWRIANGNTGRHALYCHLRFHENVPVMTVLLWHCKHEVFELMEICEIWRFVIWAKAIEIWG